MLVVTLVALLNLPEPAEAWLTSGLREALAPLQAAVSAGTDGLRDKVRALRGIGELMEKHENMAAELKPVRERYRQYSAQPGFVDDVMREGAKVCGERAERTMEEVRKRVGIR